MKIADANIILRYLLDDSEELSGRAATIINDNELLLPNEVIAEIVYVLEKVYKVDNIDISNTLLELFNHKNIKVVELDVLKEAFSLFGKRRLDFVDTLLYAYNKVKRYKVFSFDKKLNNILD